MSQMLPAFQAGNAGSNPAGDVEITGEAVADNHRRSPPASPHHHHGSEAKRNARAGRVYFIRGEHSGLIKIGWAADVQRRFKALRTGCPDDLTLIGSIPGTRQNEKKLHRKFAAERANGEWFRQSPQLLAFIAGLDFQPDPAALKALHAAVSDLIEALDRPDPRRERAIELGLVSR